MHVFELTRSLIDIESVTPNEFEIGNYLYGYLQPLAEAYDGFVERKEVEPRRNNVFACWGEPKIVFSTHMDTVPPFIPSREDDEFIWGRGACDTHGIGASMIKAVEALLEDGVRNLGILFVVGEEVDGIGAIHSNRNAAKSKYLINGEPTENKLALGSKGVLRLDLEAKGKMAHSAYPELGESAIDKLLDNLECIRQIEWPVDPILGPGTCSVGTIEGGRAANVISDHAAATVAIRVVSDMNKTKRLALSAIENCIKVKIRTETPALHLKSVPGFETTIVKYTTDVPKLGNWGEPLLIGPGSIHQAHTEGEYISKKELVESVTLYQRLVKQLLEMA